MEGNVKPTEYVPYHKADLSNIQHVGELYVNEKGQPILDEQDREQYKVEVGTSNNFNFAELFCKYGGFRNDDEYIYINGYENPAFEIDLDWDIKTPLTFHIGGEIIDARSGFEFGEFGFVYEDDSYTSFYANLTNPYIKHFKKKKIVKFTWRNPWGSISKIKKSDFWICQGDVDDLDPKSYKQTILLPCQLMKVGDVKDRLYWDVDKGKYMIEKNIGFITRNSNNNYRVRDAGKENVIIFECTDIVSDVKQPSAEGIATVSSLIKSCRTDTWNSDSEGIHFMNGGSKFRIKINKSRLDPLDSDGLKDFILKNSDQIRLYYHLQTPELIGTNITERIELPCYNPITHIIINSGNIEPSNIKALVPMKASVVTDGLICWLEANDISKSNTVKNGTVWKNRVKNGSNAIIRTIDGSDVDGVKNGLFRTHCKVYVELPSFETNNNVGMSIFVDGVINKRPSHEYNRVYTLQYNDYHTSGISLNYGYSDFGCTRCFTMNYRSLFDHDLAGPYPIPFSVASSTRIGIGFLNNVKRDY